MCWLNVGFRSLEVILPCAKRTQVSYLLHHWHQSFRLHAKRCSFWTRVAETQPQPVNKTRNPVVKLLHFYWWQIWRCGPSVHWKNRGPKVIRFNWISMVFGRGPSSPMCQCHWLSFIGFILQCVCARYGVSKYVISSNNKSENLIKIIAWIIPNTPNVSFFQTERAYKMKPTYMWSNFYSCYIAPPPYSSLAA